MSDSEEETPDRQLKIVVMGDGASGKVIFLSIRNQCRKGHLLAGAPACKQVAVLL